MAASVIGGVAHIVHRADAAGNGLLATALERTGFWDHLELVRSALGILTSEVEIVVKPELGGFALDSPAATSPRLVEELVDLLNDSGYGRVAVVAAPDSSTLWVENREILALADLLGYRYMTERGRSYDVLDLSQDLLDGKFPEGSLLHGSPLARAWRDAHFRITFAKNRTDEQNGYALSLDSLIGVLPLTDKDYYYRHRFDPADVVVELLQAWPVHFALIDALTSCHGHSGGRAPVSIETGTLIASTDVILADYAAALKMGLDPFVSDLTRRAVRRIGLPTHYRIEGNLASYEGWRNAHPIIRDSTRRRDAWTSASRAIKPWIQVVDAERFPFKEPVDQRLNDILSPRLADTEDPSTFWSLVLANYAVGSIHDALESYRTLNDKDALRWREVPLNLELKAYGPDDYAATLSLLELEPLLRDVHCDEFGLRWRYLDDAILFEFARTLPISFLTFVNRVDVSRTIQFMNDYIGGIAVPVGRDELGRVRHQAERNLYLPQPNYLILNRGNLIDVTKLEFVEYTEQRHRMSWKTIKSENESALHDDGVVSFEEAGSGTRVRIFGRQLFVLPPFWQALNLDLAPDVKTQLVTDAYRTFFSRTIANLEALVEGRPIRIGQPWHQPLESRDTEQRPVDRLGALLSDVAAKYGPLVGSLPKASAAPTPTPLGIDAQGFAHFAAPSAGSGAAQPAPPALAPLFDLAREALASFWGDVAEALRRDAEWQVLREGRGNE